VFTGLVHPLAEVVAIKPDGPGVQLVIRDGRIATDSGLGDSICVNGCCLTVVAIDGDAIAFQA
ncbi:unnamed protein product, partial [Ectocarpus sp. 4 AP-2014]